MEVLNLVDGVPTAINKENPHKTEKLETLLSKNDAITALMVGRTQGGSGTKQTDQKIDGLPFAVPSTATVTEHSKLAADQCTKDGLTIGTQPYVKKFDEYMGKIKQWTAAQ